MAHVVDSDDFDLFKEQFNELKEEVLFQRQLLGALIWLTKEQTMQILQLGRTSMWQVVKQNRLPYHKEGTRLMFHIDDVRTYLEAKKIPAKGTQERIQQALKTQKTDSSKRKAGLSTVCQHN